MRNHAGPSNAAVLVGLRGQLAAERAAHAALVMQRS
jgi:hypothetical protein